jgi:hypothetical protein
MTPFVEFGKDFISSKQAHLIQATRKQINGVAIVACSLHETFMELKTKVN